ncbi:MAG: hypothetical protein ACI4RG_03785 [Huintestinicola sp.]
MMYRNIHNGRVIDIPSQLTSPDWERAEKVTVALSEETKAAKGNEQSGKVRRTK